MYKLKKIEDLHLLPEGVKKCKIERQVILEYVYKNRNNLSGSLIVENLREILLKHTLESYKNENISSDIILSEKEINQIRYLK